MIIFLIDKIWHFSTLAFLVKKIEILSLMMLGSKLGMTQIFDDSGSRVPVTVLSVGPCYVTQLLKDYNAVQIGYKEIPENSLNSLKIIENS